jgi:hypothetical protein
MEVLIECAIPDILKEIRPDTAGHSGCVARMMVQSFSRMVKGVPL